MMDYTLRVYKKDRRCKEGELHVGDYDYPEKDPKWMSEEVRELSNGLYPSKKYRLELVETYQTRVNMMTGKPFQERFDTPYYCSPSSEAFWSN